MNWSKGCLWEKNDLVLPISPCLIHNKFSTLDVNKEKINQSIE